MRAGRGGYCRCPSALAKCPYVRAGSGRRPEGTAGRKARFTRRFPLAPRACPHTCSPGKFQGNPLNRPDERSGHSAACPTPENSLARGMTGAPAPSAAPHAPAPGGRRFTGHRGSAAASAAKNDLGIRGRSHRPFPFVPRNESTGDHGCTEERSRTAPERIKNSGTPFLSGRRDADFMPLSFTSVIVFPTLPHRDRPAQTARPEPLGHPAPQQKQSIVSGARHT